MKEVKKIKVSVETPLHISDKNLQEIAEGFWKEKGGKLLLLDVRKIDTHNLNYAVQLVSELFTSKNNPAWDRYYRETNVNFFRGRTRFVTYFIREDGAKIEDLGNPEKIYLPGSSLKGSLRTALLAKAIQNDTQLLDKLKTYHTQKGKVVFQHFYKNYMVNRRYLEDKRGGGRNFPFKDPFRAIRITDSVEKNISRITIYGVERKRVNNPVPIPMGNYEFVERGSSFTHYITFDRELWEILTEDTPFERLGIEKVNDLVDIWKEWYRNITNANNTTNTANNDIILLGRFTGRTAKTLDKLLNRKPPRTKAVIRGNQLPGRVKIELVDS